MVTTTLGFCSSFPSGSAGHFVNIHTKIDVLTLKNVKHFDFTVLNHFYMRLFQILSSFIYCFLIEIFIYSTS